MAKPYSHNFCTYAPLKCLTATHKHLQHTQLCSLLILHKPQAGGGALAATRVAHSHSWPCYHHHHTTPAIRTTTCVPDAIAFIARLLLL